MRIRTIVTVLAAVAVCACHHPAEQDNERKDVTKTVIGKRMAVDDLYGYKIVCAYDDYLFLQESRDTSRLVVYQVDGDSLKYYKGLINRGRGPYDVYYPEFSLSGDTLFVSNSDPTGMKAIFGIPLDEMSKIDDPKRWKKYSFSEYDIQSGLSFARSGDGQFVFAGGKADTKELFSLADFKNGVERIPLLFSPNDSTQGPNFAKQNVYMQCHLYSNEDRILYANMYARYMFIATVKGNALVEKAVIYSNLPEYEIKPDGNIRYLVGDNGVFPYSTPSRVYAQVGRRAKEARPLDGIQGYSSTYTDEVEVYDWNGRFIDNYKTDRPFFTFAVSPDNRFLFTLSKDLDTEERIVMRYDLKL